jgi:hypothetical protein
VIHAVEFGERIELPVPEPARSSGSFTTRPCTALSESSVDITADAVPELNRFSPVT